MRCEWSVNTANVKWMRRFMKQGVDCVNLGSSLSNKTSQGERSGISGDVKNTLAWYVMISGAFSCFSVCVNVQFDGSHVSV